MFNLTSSMRYYLYSYPTDMRRSLYSLSGMVTNQMGRNVQDGDVYIFINRSCTSMKILHLECGGLVIYHMKLVQGCFKLPVFDQNSNPNFISTKISVLCIFYKKNIAAELRNLYRMIQMEKYKVQSTEVRLNMNNQINFSLGESV
ncbi:MAG: IS66 family insertion sequence element accessory protein TnpB [Prolixibacteraceae bacterium]